MSYDIPPRYEPEIERVANERHITVDEALDRIIRAGPDRLEPDADRKAARRPYASYFGVIRGAGAHGSKAAVDRYRRAAKRMVSLKGHRVY